MKNVFLVQSAIFALLSSCGPSLKEPVAFASACTQLTSAIKGKCGDTVMVDCSALVACGAKTDQIEKVDLDTCVANIGNASGCDGATGVRCALACTSK